MNQKDFYNKLNIMEQGFHEVNLGSQPKYQDNKHNIVIKHYSYLLCLDSELILDGNINIHTSSNAICKNMGGGNVSFGICTNKRIYQSSQLILMKEGSGCIDVMEQIKNNKNSFFALIFLGEQRSTYDEICGMVYGNQEEYFEGLQLTLTDNEHYRNTLFLLYCHMVDKAFQLQSIVNWDRNQQSNLSINKKEGFGNANEDIF